jgi:hypothetical protein
MKRLSIFGLIAALAITGCGGGGSSSNNNPIATGTPPAVGSITLLVGDSVLDDIEAVLIVIDEILLLGDDGQVTISNGPLEEIDLLSLRNITEVVASTEVPAGSYSKIRLLISSLRIQELGDAPEDAVDVRLPANGKIDLNPQGAFEISSGEDLVVQIDFDLARSVKIVQTGNSQYRFRPVVFIDVLDQTDNLRLTKLFGSLQDDDDGSEGSDGEASDYDLCVPLESGGEDCVDVIVQETTSYFSAEGNVTDQQSFVLSADAHVFGHFFIGATGGEFFRAKVVAFGDEASVQPVDGDVTSAVVDGAFDLAVDDATSLSVNVVDAVLLDEMGQTLVMDIAAGQEAEAWAQTANLDVADDGVFPAFLVQVRESEVDEDCVEGQLTDLNDGVLTVLNVGLESCVVVGEDTEIQLLSDYEGDAESDAISLTALGDLISVGVEVEAFGMQNGDCLDAEVVVAEVD